MLFNQLTPKQRLTIFGILSATAATLMAVVLLNRSTSESVNLEPEQFVAALPTPPAPPVSKEIQGDFASGGDTASEGDRPTTLHQRKNEATLAESFAFDAQPKFAASFQQSGSAGDSDSHNGSENESAGASGGSGRGSRGFSTGGAASIDGNGSFVPFAVKDEENDPSGNGGGGPSTPPDDTGTPGKTKIARSGNSGNSGGSFADPAETLVNPEDDPTTGTDPTHPPVRVPDSGSTLALTAMTAAGLAILRRRNR